MCKTMVSLQNFSMSPTPGDVTICEQQGRICSLPSTEVDVARCIPAGVVRTRKKSFISRLNLTFFFLQMARYPEINIARELFQTPSSNILHSDSGRNLMMPVNESFLKHVTRKFFEEGFSAALEAATVSPNPLVKTSAKYILYLVNVGNNMRYFLRPHLRDQTLASVGKFSETKDWLRSPIRCIRWHPHCFKLAVAASDDSIRVYTDEPTTVPVLKVGTLFYHIFYFRRFHSGAPGQLHPLPPIRY